MTIMNPLQEGGLFEHGHHLASVRQPWKVVCALRLLDCNAMPVCSHGARSTGGAATAGGASRLAWKLAAKTAGGPEMASLHATPQLVDEVFQIACYIRGRHGASFR